MNDQEIQAQSSCADEYDASSLSVPEALIRINREVLPLDGHELVAVRASLGRVTAEDVVSPLDVPAHTNSAMDGYACRGEDLPLEGAKTFRLVGASFAGAPFSGSVGADECVRIMTGGVMPAGADTVVMQERVEVEGAHIRFGSGNETGQNVRSAGEDILKGAKVLDKGKWISPAELGLLASLGFGEVKVYRRPRIAFFSTGDELKSIGEALRPGDIYDSNRYTLYGMLTRIGADIVDMGVVPDRRENLQDAFRQASKVADAVITSGGVSVGEADFVKETLSSLGRVNFWKIAMKPGRPLAFGRLGEALFFGLPGNPVSVMVTFYEFVQPALRRLMGMTEVDAMMLRVPCSTRLRKKPGRVEYQRGVLFRGEKGELCVRSTGAQGSGILSSVSQANCFIVLPQDSRGAEAGTVVDVQPFQGLV